MCFMVSSQSLAGAKTEVNTTSQQDYAHSSQEPGCSRGVKTRACTRSTRERQTRDLQHLCFINCASLTICSTLATLSTTLRNNMTRYTLRTDMLRFTGGCIDARIQNTSASRNSGMTTCGIFNMTGDLIGLERTLHHNDASTCDITMACPQDLQWEINIDTHVTPVGDIPKT